MWIALGGALGAVCRFALSHWVAGSGIVKTFPLATLLVNAVGSLVLGVVVALAERDPRLPPEIKLFFGTGFCGALTTFSTFAVETLDLPLQSALGNVAANLFVSLSMAAFGLWLVRWLPDIAQTG